MNFDAFKQSLSAEAPPQLGHALQALWFDAKGDWEAAHSAAQDDTSRDGSWVHAYLHRKEGDDANAGYWYRRAGRPFPSTSLDDEWAAITAALLEAAGH